jgi:hypothetical protein
MKAGSFVLVHLANPREKFWGLLEDRDASGVTVRGLAVEGFDEWLREIVREASPAFSPSTVFFPLHRVERISLDESIGEAPSLSERFRQTVGKDPGVYLTADLPEEDEAGAQGRR